ncbi:hypothetical protein D3C73_641970 [compost metagenome]
MNARQFFLLEHRCLKLLQLLRARRHGVQEKLQRTQHVKKCLVVERQLDVLRRFEQTNRLTLLGAPGRLEELLGHFAKRGASAPMQRVRNRQHSHFGACRQAIGVTIALHVGVEILVQRGKPAAQDIRASDGVGEGRAIAFQRGQASFGRIVAVVLATLTVAAVVIDTISMGVECKAVTLASAVVSIGVKERHGLAERFRQQEAFGFGNNHVRRRDVLDYLAYGHGEMFEARRGRVQILHVGEGRGDAGIRFCRRIDHQHSAWQRAVVAQCTTQGARLFVGQQHQRQPFVQRSSCSIGEVALHIHSYNEQVAESAALRSFGGSTLKFITPAASHRPSTAGYRRAA